MNEIINTENLYKNILNLLKNSREQVLRTVNSTIVKTYFEIGRLIVENEQKGFERAEYGKETLKNLSVKLTKEFGKGFSATNLEQMRKFYKVYGISQTVSEEFKLSWSHYLVLMRMENLNERNFYEIEAINNNWSLRELKRQFNSALYERLVLSKNKEKVKELALKGQIIEKPSDVVKDPYILEFLGLEEKPNYSENDLETEIINKLEMFLLELGKGFTFVGRQLIFTFDEKHFRVDLVFYNRILRCFVLIDLKIGEVTHQDIGQMQMYVNYYDRVVKLPEENKTIGIIICREKNDTLVILGLEEKPNYSENDLETEIINKLEMFLLELGKGFTFVGRQVRFTFDEKHFRVDLVFYNRILRCFVLIDLKIGEVTHQDIGQMQMYVNYYDRVVKLPEENKTIGIIICREKNDTLVRMTLPQDNEQIFASKYEMILPSKEEIKKLIMGDE